jgi:hypothetical protein
MHSVIAVRPSIAGYLITVPYPAPVAPTADAKWNGAIQSGSRA